MLNVNGSPSGSDADGVKSYDWPATREVGGEPEIVGARFVVPGFVGPPEVPPAREPSSSLM